MVSERFASSGCSSLNMNPITEPTCSLHSLDLAAYTDTLAVTKHPQPGFRIKAST
jgi:hypothetical protein